MKIQDFKTFMQLQAIQQFTNRNNANTASSQAIFQDMLSELVSGDSLDGSSQKLGSLLSTVETEANAILQSRNASTMASSPPISPAPAERKESGTGTNYDEIISQAATLYKLPEKLIKSVIKQESNFDPKAVSYAGAAGLMQLMPATARSLGVNDPTDPEQNIMGGSKYLSQMMDRYGGNIELALAAYNAGPGNVDKYNGIPPFKETKNYVQSVYGTFLS
ncbi:lytic transglycosylase domain-containing protein [Peribacillus sp. SI8-4]|uniref:lytic transglycosylase domain-containing protein n=1 Tax=Peribacillus sp. SI8-4 TaxID=3048009 RepID=UPI00255696A2|nr:lytic transglycosylase domain-containing protein [Peribacillus sp. SI8-4]